MKRFLTWVLMGVLIAPLVLMIWYPGTFTVGLRFVLRYHLELLLPVSMQAYGLKVAYARRSSLRSRIAFLAFCGISAVSFGYLAYSYTYRVFWGATVIPACIFLIGSDVLSGKSHLLGHRSTQKQGADSRVDDQ